MATEGSPVLTESQRRLYARHVLLSELGATGQARLCASEVSIVHDAAPDAAEVAREYLQRAGVRLLPAARPAAEPGTAAQGETPALTLTLSIEVEVATRTGVRDLAGDPVLEDCAAWLAGAWAAVEAIKRCAGIGTQASIAVAQASSLVTNEERV